MRLLAIDTTSGLCSLSIWENQKKQGGITQDIQRGHAAVLAPLCQDLLREKNLKIQDMDRLLVNKGPGSFTGIRVGMAFAKALSQSTKIPLHGISAFDAAFKANTPETRNTLIILDARRKDYYCQLILEGQKQTPTSLTPAEISNLINAHSPTLIGNGAATVSSVLSTEHLYSPSPREGADALIQAYTEGEIQEATPFYLRNADITLKAC